MFNEWIQVAYEHQQKDAAETALFETMAKLPERELYKIAMGEKVAYGGGLEWLEQYKATPLFEQAVQLEQENIQLSMADQQERDQDRMLSDQRSQICMKKRLLDLQLVGWQQQQLTGGPPPGGAPPAGPAGPPPGPPPAPPVEGPPPGAETPVKTAGEKGPLTLGEGLLAFGLGGPTTYLGAKKGKEHSGEALEGGVRATLGYMGGSALGSGLGGMGARALGAGEGGQLLGSALGSLGGGIGGYKLLTRKYNDDKKPKEEKKEAADVAHAVAWGQQLARADAEKIAEMQQQLEMSVAMGRAMAKEALDPTALLGQVKGLASKAVGYAKQNPAIAAGALGGAATGLVGGLQKDENGQRHPLQALGGAVAGAATGGLGAHAAQNIGTSMANGTSLGAAAKHYASQWGNVARNAVSRVGTAVAPTAALAPAMPVT